MYQHTALALTYLVALTLTACADPPPVVLGRMLITADAGSEPEQLPDAQTEEESHVQADHAAPHHADDAERDEPAARK